MKKKKKKEIKELSILDLARSEKKQSNKEYSGVGNGKKHTHEVFRMWLALPDQFKGMPERVTALLGITDDITLELLKLTTMKSFSDEFGVKPPTLSRWRSEIESKDTFLDDVKKGMRKLTKNVSGALYRKMVEEGDASRFKIWVQYFEDWREQLGIDHSGSISVLTEEEKATLNNLIKKNTSEK